MTFLIYGCLDRHGLLNVVSFFFFLFSFFFFLFSFFFFLFSVSMSMERCFLANGALTTANV